MFMILVLTKVGLTCLLMSQLRCWASSVAQHLFSDCTRWKMEKLCDIRSKALTSNGFCTMIITWVNQLPSVIPLVSRFSWKRSYQ